MKRLLIVLLLLAPVALPGLAHASPPDPTWIHGIYDDDDGDSVVTLIASGTSIQPPPHRVEQFARVLEIASPQQPLAPPGHPDRGVRRQRIPGPDSALGRRESSIGWRAARPPNVSSA